MRIGIFGRGRLALAVVKAAEAAGVQVLWTLGRGEEPPAEPRPDAALEASAAAAVEGRLRWALKAGVPLVIGTTGWEPGLVERVAGSSPPLGIMLAPNFSLGMAMTRRLATVLGRYAALDPAADLSVYERHHRAKKDAPSGSAKLLAAALAEGGAEKGVAMASLRGGSAVGYHECRLDADGESIALIHDALDRGIFAKGALGALAWLAGKRGLYRFDDYCAELLDPLFTLDRS